MRSSASRKPKSWASARRCCLPGRNSRRGDGRRRFPSGDGCGSGGAHRGRRWRACRGLTGASARGRQRSGCAAARSGRVDSQNPADGVGNNMPITLLDGILVGFTLVSAMLAMVRGFSREILSIASWVAAAAAAFFFYQAVLPYIKPYVDSPQLAMAAAAGVVFIIALIVVSVITMKIADCIIDSRVGALDRTLGFSMAPPGACWSSPSGCCSSTGWSAPMRRPGSPTPSRGPCSRTSAAGCRRCCRKILKNQSSTAAPGRRRGTGHGTGGRRRTAGGRRRHRRSAVCRRAGRPAFERPVGRAERRAAGRRRRSAELTADPVSWHRRATVSPCSGAILARKTVSAFFRPPGAASEPTGSSLARRSPQCRPRRWAQRRLLPATHRQGRANRDVRQGDT